MVRLSVLRLAAVDSIDLAAPPTLTCVCSLSDAVLGNDIKQNVQEIKYDKAVLATGSYPFVPPTPGVDKKGVFVYRTIDDLEVGSVPPPAPGRRVVSSTAVCYLVGCGPN